MTESLEKTPRMEITATTTPAPPWTRVKFTCEKCQGEFQLEAADPCVEQTRMEFESRKFATPPCPTEGCGHVNIISITPELQDSNPT